MNGLTSSEWARLSAPGLVRPRNGREHATTRPTTVDWLPLACPAPQWVERLCGGDVRRRGTISEGLEVECRVRGAFSLTSICIPRIADRTADSLESAVADGYEAIGDQLRNHSHHAIRLWNFVPDIHAHVRPGIDRYMVFNAGRFCGYERWYGSASEFGVSLAAASAVGTFDDTLRIYCLGAEIPGVALENPRQIPAYRYSARYGPRPPCFAPATMVD